MKVQDEIRKALNLSQTAQLSFLDIFDEQTIGGHVCAFLNGSGGYVITRLPGPESYENINNKLHDYLIPHPTIFTYYKEFPLLDGTYLIIEVPQGHDKPYSYNSQFYLFSSNSQKVFAADTETILSMMSIASIHPIRWERQFSDGFSIDDMAWSEKNELIKLHYPDGHYIVNGKDELALMKGLEKLAMMRDGRLTNAADIIFSKHPSIRHPQTRVKAICSTTKTSETYKDYQIFEGPLLKVLEDTMDFILKHITYQATFSVDSMKRIDNPQYPTEAIREGLVNAFAHRDYSSYSGGIQIEILPDKLIIKNSGSLPDGVTVKSLNKGQVSVLRNPDIAQYMYLRKYMEMIGRGSMTIIQACLNAGLKNPKWESTDNSVSLTFFADRNEIKLSSTAKKIIIMLANGPLGKKELANGLGQTSISSTLNNAISQLFKDFGFIEWTIPDHPQSKSQQYRLTDRGKEYLHQTDKASQ